MRARASNALFDIIQRIKRGLQPRLFDDPYKQYIEDEEKYLRERDVERKINEEIDDNTQEDLFDWFQKKSK